MADFPKETEIQQKLEKQFGALVSNFKIARARRIFAETDGKNAKQIIEHMQKKLSFNHLSTITGMDAGENYLVLYHLALSGGLMLTLKAKIPASNPEIQTITDLFPGADPYERELEDMFGIKVEGLKPGNRYPLPDNWPAGQYPLRKSWKQSDLYPKEENTCQK